MTPKSVFAIAAVAILALAACGGGSKSSAASGAKPPPPDPKVVNVANFCHDYTVASNDYASSGGDVDDPDFIKFEVDLTAAQKEAPAAVADNVTSMLAEVNQTDAADSAGKAVSGDLSKWSNPVAAWANANCPAATATTLPVDSGCTTDEFGDCTTDTSAGSDTPTSTDLCYPNGNPPLDSDTSGTGLVPCPAG